MSNEFDQVADSYQDELNSTLRRSGQSHDFFVQDKIRHLKRLLAQAPRASKELKVLDVGCGVGLGHERIADMVGSLHGVDVSAESIRVAQEKNKSVHYQTYPGYPLPFDADEFDVCFTICVMHHVPPSQWRSFLKEVRRVLKPGGQLIVIEHNPFNPATQWIVRTTELDREAVLLNPYRLSRMLQECNFPRTQTHFTLFTPFTHSFFRWLDRTLWWLPLGAQYVTEARKPARP